MKRNFLFALVLILFFFIGLSSFFSNDNKGLVQEVFTETNQFRKSEGLAKLVIRKDLNVLAQKHSEDMASGRVGFGHDGFEERNAVAQKEIKDMHSFAENVAYGATSGKEVITMWESSPGHRRNMLGQYQYTGIGVAKDSQGRIYYTEVFAD
ncbi:MAG: CAP domain-containing protein [Bacteroidota bacterium]|nr:CAP domain-containing protein [Bacteroidota bacterium]